jgi:hypothetical protein
MNVRNSFINDCAYTSDSIVFDIDHDERREPRKADDGGLSRIENRGTLYNIVNYEFR